MSMVKKETGQRVSGGMMKKMFVSVLVLVLISSMFAVVGSAQNVDAGKKDENPRMNETGKAPEQPSMNETGKMTDQGKQVQTGQEETDDEEPLLIQERERLRVNNSTELRQMLQQREQEMEQATLTVREQVQNVSRNQNSVR